MIKIVLGIFGINVCVNGLGPKKLKLLDIEHTIDGECITAAKLKSSKFKKGIMFPDNNKEERMVQFSSIKAECDKFAKDAVHLEGFSGANCDGNMNFQITWNGLDKLDMSFCAGDDCLIKADPNIIFFNCGETDKDVPETGTADINGQEDTTADKENAGGAVNKGDSDEPTEKKTADNAGDGGNAGEGNAGDVHDTDGQTESEKKKNNSRDNGNTGSPDNTGEDNNSGDNKLVSFSFAIIFSSIFMILFFY